jgi:hypothetical protein
MTSDTASPPAAAFRAAGDLSLLTWPALDASGADAAVTARSGGVSSGPYATLNLSLNVGDDLGRVLENRRRLAAAFGADPGDFVFARQVHGAGVSVVAETDRGSGAFSLDDAVAGHRLTGGSTRDPDRGLRADRAARPGGRRARLRARGLARHRGRGDRRGPRRHARPGRPPV